MEQHVAATTPTIGIIIPDRGDRPGFTDNLIGMIGRQTYTGRIKVAHIDHAAKDDAVDITPRYRLGYKVASNIDEIDVIAFMENDDWYSPKYLEVMVEEWQKAGQPELFGIRHSIYYHLKLRKYFKNLHDQRSPAMSTLIKPRLTFQWPLDHDPYFDQWIWMREEIGIKSKMTIDPIRPICIGMKHGIGKLGGQHHIDRLERYINDDPHMEFLQDHLDEESYKFFSTIQL